LLKVFFALAFVLTCSVNAWAQNNKSATPKLPLSPDIQKIVDRGELIVAMPRNDSPPFFFLKNGETLGIDADLARGLARELKVKLRFHREAASFNDVVDVVARGEADVAICKLSRTVTRAKSILFSEPYLQLRHVLALNRIRFAELSRGRELPTVIHDFSGTIGVIANSSYAEFALRNFPKAKIVEFRDWDEVLGGLKRGDVVGAYRDEFEISRFFKADPRASLTLRTVTFTDTQDSLGAAVAYNNGQLLSLINLYLAQRPDKLTVDKILNWAENQ